MVQSNEASYITNNNIYEESETMLTSLSSLIGPPHNLTQSVQLTICLATAENVVAN